jgi:MarR family transcriptional regulator, lower aerobic nicotinate degradation pathway regulator
MNHDVENVVNTLRRIVRALRLSSTEAERRLGITGAQLFVLQQLAEHSSLSVGELAARTLTDQSSVSVVIARLCARKLVVRRPSPTDGRRVEVSVTSAGRAALRKAPKLAQTRLIQALRKVPKGKLRVVSRVLDDVAGEMGAERAGMFLEGDGVRARR